MHSNAMSSEASGHTASNGLAVANGQGPGHGQPRTDGRVADGQAQGR